MLYRNGTGENIPPIFQRHANNLQKLPCKRLTRFKRLLMSHTTEAIAIFTQSFLLWEVYATMSAAHRFKSCHRGVRRFVFLDKTLNPKPQHPPNHDKKYNPQQPTQHDYGAFGELFCRLCASLSKMPFTYLWLFSAPNTLASSTPSLITTRHGTSREQCNNS